MRLPNYTYALTCYEMGSIRIIQFETQYILLKNTSPSALKHWIFIERTAHRLLCSSHSTERSD